VTAGDPPAEVAPDVAGGEGPADEAAAPVPRRARTAGIALFLVAIAVLVFLAVLGFEPALYLLVLAVVGTGLVVVGTRLH
jgi:hypothetical protein